MTAASSPLVGLLWTHWLIGLGGSGYNTIAFELSSTGRKYVDLTIYIHVRITARDLAIKDIKRLGDVAALSLCVKGHSRGSLKPPRGTALPDRCLSWQVTRGLEAFYFSVCLQLMIIIIG